MVDDHEARAGGDKLFNALEGLLMFRRPDREILVEFLASKRVENSSMASEIRQERGNVTDQSEEGANM